MHTPDPSTTPTRMLPPAQPPARGRVFANALRRLAHEFDMDADVSGEAIDLLVKLQHIKGGF